MASFVTGTATGNTLTRIGWSSKLHREAQSRFFFQESGMRERDMGDEPTFERRRGAPVIVQEVLNAGRAQQVRVALVTQLTTNRGTTVRINAAGTVGISSYTYGTTGMKDNEETPSLSSFTAWVEQMKHATSFVTPELQDLRTEFKMRVQASNLLADWIAAEMEEATLDAAYHRFSAHVIGGLSQSAADPPTANLFYANRKADAGSLGTGDGLTAAELRRMATWFETANINPIKGGGKRGAILLCHPYAYADIWADEEFREYQSHGNVRGTGNPAMDNADLEFHGIYLWKYNRVRTGLSGDNAANVRRLLLLGSDALAEGVTMRPRMVIRKEDDYEDVYGVGVKAINGWARADWAPTSGTTINQSLAIWSVYTADSV